MILPGLGPRPIVLGHFLFLWVSGALSLLPGRHDAQLVDASVHIVEGKLD